MAQQRKAPAPRVQRGRILRVGIIQGGKIIEERLVRSPKDISIGQGPHNSFVISSENLPRTYTVFKILRDGRYALRFAEGMEGRVTVGGSVRTLRQVREMGAARRMGDWWHLPMDPSARGKLVVGEVTLLFQFVKAPLQVPRARLPATIQGSVGSRVDPPFTVILAGCVALAAAFWITVQVVPKPSGEARSNRLRQLVTGELKRSYPRPERPRVPLRDDADRKDRDGEKVPGEGIRQAQAAGGPKGAGKGPLKKGTAEYKQRLAELTNISLRQGSDKMNAVAIAGKCTNPEDCENAIQGPDHMQKGFSTGSLDQAAATADKAGGHGLGGASPGSGSGGRRGLVGGGGKGGIAAGSGVGTGDGSGGGTGARRPVRVAAIKGQVDSFVPPAPAAGGAGEAIRAKIRNRILSLRACYNQALISNPKLSGTAQISFVIMPNGRLSNVNVSSGLGGGMVGCLQSKVASWHLGTIPSQIFYGPFSVRFTPGG
ncbi:MAG: AgmX/PglI C-terminal domain-containing protein [Polyangia bacterium]|jgi:hypothetical protein|nr:AgmX/PglI C-terminal domain-containing protein [Polyangia bacterium]